MSETTAATDERNGTEFADVMRYMTRRASEEGLEGEVMVALYDVLFEGKRTGEGWLTWRWRRWRTRLRDRAVSGGGRESNPPDPDPGSHRF